MERLRALLIEDDSDIRSLFADVLAEAQIEVVSANISPLPTSGVFDVVVTDLPGTFYDARQARAWVDLVAGRFSAPIVVVTARQEALADQGLRRSAMVRQKPIDIEELVAAVRAAANGGASLGGAALHEQVDA